MLSNDWRWRNNARTHTTGFLLWHANMNKDWTIRQFKDRISELESKVRDFKDKRNARQQTMFTEGELIRDGES